MNPGGEESLIACRFIGSAPNDVRKAASSRGGLSQRGARRWAFHQTSLSKTDLERSVLSHHAICSVNTFLSGYTADIYRHPPPPPPPSHNHVFLRCTLSLSSTHY